MNAPLDPETATQADRGSIAMRTLRHTRAVFWSLLAMGLLLVVLAGGCSSDGASTQPEPAISDPGAPYQTDGEKVRHGDQTTPGEWGS